MQLLANTENGYEIVKWYEAEFLLSIVQWPKQHSISFLQS